MLFIISPKTRRHRWLKWLCNISISLENRRSNESLLFYTYIALDYIYRGLKYIHKGSQHAPILEWQLTVVQRESKTWINGTGEGNHIKNIYGDDVTITIYGLVPDYVVGRSTSHCWRKKIDPRCLFLIPMPPCSPISHNRLRHRNNTVPARSESGPSDQARSCQECSVGRATIVVWI